MNEVPDKVLVVDMNQRTKEVLALFGMVVCAGLIAFFAAPKYFVWTRGLLAVPFVRLWKMRKTI